jgi:glycosyltransferase involved in cell wall biosynthesis
VCISKGHTTVLGKPISILKFKKEKKISLPVKHKESILMVIPNSIIGGSEILVEDVCKGLSTRYNVDILVLFTKGNLHSRYEEAARNVYHKVDFLQLIKKNKYDFIQFFHHFNTLDCVEQAIKEGFKVILSLYSNFYSERKFWFADIQRIKRLSSSLYAFITNSAINQIIFPDIQVLPMGIDTNLFIPRAKISRTACTVARADPNKGLEYFIAVARELPDYNFTMVLSGNQDYVDHLKIIAPNNVEIKTNLSRKDTAEVLSRNEIFLFYSVEECLPLVILEAMASGCYVISTPVGNVPDVINKGTGYLLETKKYVIETLSAIKMGIPRLKTINARKLVEDIYSLNRMIFFYGKLFDHKLSLPRTKIMYIISSLERGGAETCLRNLLMGLSPDDYEKHLIVTHTRGTMYEEISKYVDSITCLEDYNDKEKRIVDILRSTNPEYIHITNLLDFYKKGGVLWKAKSMGIKLIGSIFMTLHYNRTSWAEQYAHVLALSPHMECLITDSHDNTSLFDNAYLISNGVNVNLFRPGKKIPKTVTWIGRFIEAKGASLVYDIASKLPYHSFTMISSSMDKGFSRKKKPDNVTIKLSLTQEEVAEILSTSTYFLTTSRIESMPLSILEAMSSGCCCISTNVGDVSRTITDGINGYIIPHIELSKLKIGNPVLAKDLTTFYRDVISYVSHNMNNFSPDVGLKARETILDKYNRDDWIRKYEFLYGRIKKDTKKRMAFIWSQNVSPKSWSQKEDSMQYAMRELTKTDSVICFLRGDYKKRFILNNTNVLYYKDVDDLILELDKFNPDIIVFNTLSDTFIDVAQTFDDAFQILVEYGGVLKHELYNMVDVAFVQEGFRKQECLDNNSGIKPDQIFINPFGVQLDEFVKHKYDAIMVADFRKEVKRQELLIRAWQYVDGKLLLLGSFSQGVPYVNYLSEMKALVRELGLLDKVEFMDFVDHEMLPDVIKRAKIGILTSSREGGSRVLVEIMACGLPVIVCSDCEGNMDRVENKKTGLIVDPTPKALANGINYLLKDDDRRRKMGEKAAEYIHEMFAYPDMYNIYKRIINKSEIEVSIITTSFNRGEFIEDCVKSVADLTGNYKINHLIMDGGSSDDTFEILKKYNVDLRVGDKGQTDALNKAMKVINKEYLNTRYIGWINADDYYHSEFLDSSVKIMESNPDVMMTCTDVDQVDVDGNYVKTIKYTTSNSMNPEGMLVGNIIIQPSVLLRKDMFNDLAKKYGFHFNPEYDYTQDYELWYRIMKEGYRVYHINMRGAYLRSHSKQMSRLKRKEQNVDRLKVLEQFQKLVNK